MKTVSIKIQPNAIRSILALTKASALGTLRNKTSMFFNFFFPFIFITIFGALNMSQVSYDVGIKSTSIKDGPVYEALKQVKVVKLITDKTDSELTDGLKKGTIPVVIDIQPDPSTQILPQGQPQIPHYNLSVEKSAADPNGAATVTAILENITNKINYSTVQPETMMVSTGTTEVSGRKYQQIDFILPGQLAFALLSNALFGISYAFVAMKKELILKRFFATPIQKSWILIGEVLAKILVSLAQALVIIGVGYFVFNFTLANGVTTFLEMVFLSVIGIISFLSFGVFTASISKNEDAVTPITQLFLMPQVFLSGAFFPVEAFPTFIQPIAKILPLTLLNDALKMVAFEGVPLTQTIPNIIGILLWAVVVYAISARFFKWE